MLKKLLPLCLILTWLSLAIGWATPSLLRASSVQQQIEALIHEKEAAVNAKEKSRFLSVINPSYPFYVQEQKRWYDDAVRWIDPGSYRLRLISVIPEREHQLRAWIEQSYRRKGKVHTTHFPLLFQETESGWKDSDYPFHTVARENVVVRYTESGWGEQASIALEAAHKAVHQLKKKMDWKPKHPVEVKIYHKPEWFRQSVKLSLPKWAGGWHEAGESIKLIGARGYTDQQLTTSGFVHEVTHMMVSDLTGDNAAYWLQEGAAEYYQSHLLPGLRTQQAKKNDQPQWKMSRLEQINLERLGDKEAKDYYFQCYRFFRYMIETYGEEKMRHLFSVLALSPEVDQDTGEKLTQVNRRTREAIKKVFGKTLEQLEQDWVADMKKRGKEQSDESIQEHFGG